MIKKFLSIATLLLFLGSATAVAQVKIGYLNTQEVMNQLPEMEQVQNDLRAFIQKKQEELTQKATNYQEQVAAYQSSRGAMSQQQIEQKEEELTNLTTELEEFDQQVRLEIQRKRQELLAPIYTSMNNAIKAVAEEEGLDFVLNEATSAGESVVFYASGNQLNITQQVINRLTSSSQ